MTAAPPGPRDRCLDCFFCRGDVEFESGSDYICIRFGKPLSKRKLWGRPCAAFKPLCDADAGGRSGGVR